MISGRLTAQVIINEYSCSNISTIAESYNQYEDWIEFYNPDAVPHNLNSYHLSDDPNQVNKWQFHR